MTLLVWLACTSGSVEVDPPEADADTDADADSDTDTDTDVPQPFTFSVMGDIPYGESEIAVLDEHVALHNGSSPSQFMVHVGDIKSQSDPCDESVYTGVKAQLDALDVPWFMLVGDNEWNDCPDPDEAWGFWEANYGTPPAIEGLVTQDVRPENFAFVREQVLYVGWTMPGGKVHDEEAWAEFLDQGADWIESQLAANPDAVAAVLLTHAKPAASHEPFTDRLVPMAADFNRPMLLIHGDGHVWIMDIPWSDAPNLVRVQVEPGGDAVPLQVTVDPSAQPIWVLDREAL